VGLLKQIAWICQYQLQGNVKRRPVGHGNEEGRNTLNVARVPPHLAGNFVKITPLAISSD
jgi:hypothetical protein